MIQLWLIIHSAIITKLLNISSQLIQAKKLTAPQIAEFAAITFGFPLLDLGAFDKEQLTRDFFKQFDFAIDAIKADLEEHQGSRGGES